MGFRIREFSRDYLLYPEFGADKDRDDIQGGGGGGDSGDGFDPTNEGNYVWIIENGEAIILYFLGGTRQPKIPDKLDDKKVVAIAATAFNYSDVEKVKFSADIRWIG